MKKVGLLLLSVILVLSLIACSSSVDKADLNTLIEVCEALTETDYSPTSWAAFETKLDAAIAVNENKDATQDEVDAAISDLETAKTALSGISSISIDGSLDFDVEGMEAGDDIKLNEFVSGDIKVTYADTTNQTIAITSNMVSVSSANGEATISYKNKTVKQTLTGFTLVTDETELLAAIANKDKLIFVEGDDYTVASLRFAYEVIIFGNDVTVTLTGSESGQTAALFQANCTINGLNFFCDGSLVEQKVAVKISTLQDVSKSINKAFVKDSTITGGQGALNLSLVGTSANKGEVTLVNVTLEVDAANAYVKPDQNKAGGVVLSVAMGTDVIIIDSTIGEGAWGSVGIMHGAHADYLVPSSVEFINCDISNHVYKESPQDTITGLDWTTTPHHNGTGLVYVNPDVQLS